ncbi:MAG: protein kinase, partial [Anaerolineales bacterium]|nr:protein kinase [Anaerolineales bacterium]
MAASPTFGQIVRERRTHLGLTQAELARRISCATVTVRKIEYDAIRPSMQIAEQLAFALNIPENEQLAFVRLARAERPLTPIPTPSPLPHEIGLDDLSGRAIKGFELAERIGSGGFGVVYRGVQPSVARDVAVKIIHPQHANHPAFIRRFEAEAQIVARLEHPHVVPLYDYWREPNGAYLIMRLLRGGSLEAELQNGPIPLPIVNNYLQQFGLALHAAHKAGVVHRDIKPANILLDEEKNAYLADFGIAKHLDIGGEQPTTAGVLIGSPAYVSPEQIRSEPIKPQTDIYCLGIMLFELLTGQKPFSGPSPIHYLQQHLETPLPSVSTQNGLLPSAVDTIIAQATAKNPSDRYGDMQQLLHDFQQLAQPQPLFAAAPLPDGVELENPYRGLRPFTEADAAGFFGRDNLIHDLLGLICNDVDDGRQHKGLHRFLALAGPSGSGKS